jgi:hypothetical protein
MMKRFQFGFAVFALFFANAVVIGGEVGSNSNNVCQTLTPDSCFFAVDKFCDEINCVGEFPNLPTCPSNTSETRSTNNSISVVAPAAPGEAGYFLYNHSGAQVICGEKRACSDDCNLMMGTCNSVGANPWIAYQWYNQPVGTGATCVGL